MGSGQVLGGSRAEPGEVLVNSWVGPREVPSRSGQVPSGPGQVSGGSDWVPSEFGPVPGKS